MMAPVVLILLADITFQPSGRYLLGSLKVFAIALCIALAVASLYSSTTRSFAPATSPTSTSSIRWCRINVISSSINAAARVVKPCVPQRTRRTSRSSAHGDDARQPGGRARGRRVFPPQELQRLRIRAARYESGPTANGGTASPRRQSPSRASTLYALPKILEKNDIKLTTLVSRAGIPTSCYVNYTLYDNCAAVGETKVSHCSHGESVTTKTSIPLLRENLSTYSSGYRFIVLHLGGGSHGPALRGSPSAGIPASSADVYRRGRGEQMLDRRAVQLVRQHHSLCRSCPRTGHRGARRAHGVPYVFIYVSDHGESLLEDGMMFHGMPPGMSLARGAGGDSIDREILDSGFHRTSPRVSTRQTSSTRFRTCSPSRQKRSTGLEAL